jgi:hypothetical protein
MSCDSEGGDKPPSYRPTLLLRRCGVRAFQLRSLRLCFLHLPYTLIQEVGNDRGVRLGKLQSGDRLHRCFSLFLVLVIDTQFFESESALLFVTEWLLWWDLLSRFRSCRGFLWRRRVICYAVHLHSRCGLEPCHDCDPCEGIP